MNASVLLMYGVMSEAVLSLQLLLFLAFYYCFILINTK